MTYQVDLVAHSAPDVARDAFEASLRIEGWQPAADGVGLEYRNPDTGASAVIEHVRLTDVPSPFLPTGVAFRLHYGRPSWFALETIPAFARAAEHSGLWVIDPQAADDHPVEPDADALIESWNRGNRAAIAATVGLGQAPETMSPSASIAWWRHQRALPALRERFASDHYVPSLHLLAVPGQRSVQRAMSWPDMVPALVPDCDVFLLLRSSSTGFELAGAAEYGVVRPSLDDLLVPASVDLDGGTYSVPVLPPAHSAAAADRLSSITLSPVTAAFRTLSVEAFVDVGVPNPAGDAAGGPGR